MTVHRLVPHTFIKNATDVHLKFTFPQHSNISRMLGEGSTIRFNT